MTESQEFYPRLNFIIINIKLPHYKGSIMTAEITCSEDTLYRMRLNAPIQRIIVALWAKGETVPQGANDWSDAEILMYAAKKIETLKKLLVASGMNPAILKTIMED